MKNILNILDGIFGRVASWVLITVLYSCFCFKASVELVSVPIAIFEYGEGFSDLDLSELAILLLLPLAIWRYVWRCRQQRWGWWQLCRQFGFVVGAFALLKIIFWRVLLAEDGQNIAALVSDVELTRATWVPVEHLILILCIYGAAPLPKLIADRVAKPAPDVPEPSERKSPTFDNVDAWGITVDESPQQQEKSQEANV